MAVEVSELIIPNAKEVAARSATLWTGYIGLGIMVADLALKFLPSYSGMQPETKVVVLAVTTALGMVLRFWQQNLSKSSTTLKE